MWAMREWSGHGMNHRTIDPQALPPLLQQRRTERAPGPFSEEIPLRASPRRFAPNGLHDRNDFGEENRLCLTQPGSNSISRARPYCSIRSTTLRMPPPPSNGSTELFAVISMNGFD